MRPTTDHKRVELVPVTKEILKDPQWSRQFKSMLLDMWEFSTFATLPDSELINHGYYAINAISEDTETRTLIGFVEETAARVLCGACLYVHHDHATGTYLRC